MPVDEIEVIKQKLVDQIKPIGVYLFGSFANGTDELAECSVDIYLTGYRNASLGKTAVNVARYASELCLECRPALSCQCNELTISSVLLDPVKKSDLVLCKLV